MSGRRLVEVRSYKLKPCSGARFHDLASNQSIPLLHAVQMDVVAFGLSAHEDDTYFLIRSFENLESLRAEQEAFYGSAAWRQGPREAILELIESDATIAFWTSAEAVEAMRRSTARSP
jgi:hypothetical protein